MVVVVEPHNPKWAQDFQEIKAELEHFLRNEPYLSIEHVGSTSVEGLAAKPIIDIDIVVTREQLQDVISALQHVDTQLLYMGELGIKDRHAFRAPHQLPTRNLYVCIEGSAALRNHFAVRDLLRENKSIREEYAQFKLALSQRLLLREFVIGDVQALQAAESTRTMQETETMLVEMIKEAGKAPRRHIDLAVLVLGNMDNGEAPRLVGRASAVVDDLAERIHSKGIPWESEATGELGDIEKIEGKISVYVLIDSQLEDQSLVFEARDAFLRTLANFIGKKAPDTKKDTAQDQRNVTGMELLEQMGFTKTGVTFGIGSIHYELAIVR
ncbi:hypothetical protein N0V90_011418 [Kalmusia sp. IMI 367209]|nr:hypothetical protein N0V90_011418 [Kalmusia sp. IMI 367209]